MSDHADESARPVTIAQVYEHAGALSRNPRYPADRLPATGHRIKIVQVPAGRARTIRYVKVDPPRGGNGRRDRQPHPITKKTLDRAYRLVVE